VDERPAQLFPDLVLGVPDMPASDYERMLGSLVARMDAMERSHARIEGEQTRMAGRQDDILDNLHEIRSVMDQARGGMTAGKWFAGFLGLGSVSGIVDLFAWLGSLSKH